MLQQRNTDQPIMWQQRNSYQQIMWQQRNADQPIMWEQYHALNPSDMDQQLQVVSTSTIPRMGNTCDRSMMVGAIWAGLSISITADFLGFYRTTICRVYSEYCNKE